MLHRQLTPIDARYKGQISVSGRSFFQLSSNDYLGLSAHPDLIFQAQSSLKSYGFGSTGARLLSGDYQLTHTLEKQISTALSKQACLLFNSGFQLNSGVLPTLLSKHHVVFADKFIHASLIDGVLASGATLIRYSHQNLNHLTHLLQTHRHTFKQAFIITETLFSMDGDITDLKTIIDLKKRFTCSLYVDDAHGFGMYGQNGYGLTDGYEADIDFIVATFGKSCGSSGAFIACDQYHKDFLVNTCRSFIFSTALPLPVVAWNLGAITLLPQLNSDRHYVHSLAKQCRHYLKNHRITYTGDGHIISVVTGPPDSAVSLATACQEAGYWVLPIRPPTVPPLRSRVRLCFSPFINQTQVLDLCHVIKKHLSS